MGDALDPIKSALSKHFEVFNSQDTENGDFDVVFQLGDKKLYAHKHMLACLSKPFEVMFSERWKTKDEPIKIDNYSFDDFKEFLNHFYFSECKLTNENICEMVDLAEFYDVPKMKDQCDEFLSKTETTLENVLIKFEISQIYSYLPMFQSSVKSFMLQNLSSLLKLEDFMKIEKELLKDIAGLQRSNSQEMEFFEAVYKWAEHQAIIKQSSTEDETFDLNKAIKEELADILPEIRFERMGLDFLHKFVLLKGFLFSYPELSKILQKAKSGGTYVTIVSSNGKTLTGKLSSYPSVLPEIYDTITSAKDPNSWGGQYYQYWDTERLRPSKPSQLKKNNNVKYYLIFDADGDLAVKSASQINDYDYLLAELDGDDGFELTEGCQIEAVHKF